MSSVLSCLVSSCVWKGMEGSSRMCGEDLLEVGDHFVTWFTPLRS